MSCDGDGCPDLTNYVPTLRMVGAPQMANILPSRLNGQLQGFGDRFMRPFGLAMMESKSDYADQNALTAAIEQSETGLTLLPYSATRHTQPCF